MRAAILLVCAAAFGACAGSAALSAPQNTRATAAPAAAPTTRLILAGRSAGRDVDCADVAGRRDADALLRSDPRDPYGLDADRDGVACEHIRR